MKRLSAFWRILTLKCDEASRISSAELDGPVPAVDQVALRLHEIGCRSCRRFSGQIRELHTISGRMAASIDPPGPQMPESTRESILRSIDENRPTG
jgi:predicted anti-sigma-YlaC factor YlaD